MSTTIEDILRASVTQQQQLFEQGMENAQKLADKMAHLVGNPNATAAEVLVDEEVTETPLPE